MENIHFHRKDVAKILNVVPATIANREKNGTYPEPQRDVNGYRIYNLTEVFKLQLLTYSKIDPHPIISLLYDKGHHDVDEIKSLIDDVVQLKAKNKK